MRKSLIVPALLCTLFATAACGNTADGMKKDAEANSEKVAEAGDAAGSAMAGGAKTADVKTALMADSLVVGTDINVDTNEETKTVTLNGTVQSEAARDRAEQVAKDNATGYTVVNKLTIKK